MTWLHRPTLRSQARGGGVSCCAGGDRILGPGSREGGLTMGSGFDCVVFIHIFRNGIKGEKSPANGTAS